MIEKSDGSAEYQKAKTIYNECLKMIPQYIDAGTSVELARDFAIKIVEECQKVNKDIYETAFSKKFSGSLGYEFWENTKKELRQI